MDLRRRPSRRVRHSARRFGGEPDHHRWAADRNRRHRRRDDLHLSRRHRPDDVLGRRRDQHLVVGHLDPGHGGRRRRGVVVEDIRSMGPRQPDGHGGRPEPHVHVRRQQRHRELFRELCDRGTPARQRGPDRLRRRSARTSRRDRAVDLELRQPGTDGLRRRQRDHDGSPRRRHAAAAERNDDHRRHRRPHQRGRRGGRSRRATMSAGSPPAR